MNTQRKCSRCSSENNLTRHHIYSRQWNKIPQTAFRHEIREHTIVLCRGCHDRIERILWSLHKVYGRLPEEVYLTLAVNF